MGGKFSKSKKYKPQSNGDSWQSVCYSDRDCVSGNNESDNKNKISFEYILLVMKDILKENLVNYVVHLDDSGFLSRVYEGGRCNFIGTYLVEDDWFDGDINKRDLIITDKILKILGETLMKVDNIDLLTHKIYCFIESDSKKITFFNEYVPQTDIPPTSASASTTMTISPQISAEDIEISLKNNIKTEKEQKVQYKSYLIEPSFPIPGLSLSRLASNKNKNKNKNNNNNNNNSVNEGLQFLLGTERKEKPIFKALSGDV